MLGGISLAEEVQDDLPIDQSTAAVVEFGLIALSVPAFGIVYKL